MHQKPLQNIFLLLYSICCNVIARSVQRMNKAHLRCV